MQISVLGPFEIRDDGRDLTPTAPRVRAVLAVLAMSPNRVVPAETLVDELWDGAPPAGASSTLQTYVYQLRKLLRKGTGRPDPIATRPPGYCLRIEPGNIDAERFARLAREGHRAFGRGDAESASRLLGTALDLWRGRPLTDVPAGPLLFSHRTRLEEARLSALGDRIAADLELRRHTDVVSELRMLTVEYPLHERFHEQLMTALHGSGRRAEALDAYQRLRVVLTDELGLEPSAETRRVHRAILRAGNAGPGASPAPAPLVATPAQLPPDIADFTGRHDEVTRLEALLDPRTAESALAPRVVLITGMPGIGKTTLAVHVGQRLRKKYPDGQLFACLHTPHGAPVTPEAVLTGFLRAAGVDEPESPTSLDERTKLFRTWCADRRVLIVLDDAMTAAQLQPLLPGGGHCAVIVTSCHLLPGLPRTGTVQLAGLPRSAAHELLGSVAGGRLLAGASADAIVELCGGIPLALRAAGMLLATRSPQEPQRLAERLADKARTLRELRVPELDLTTRLRRVCDRLHEEVRSALPVLGMLAREGFDRRDAARILRIDPDSAERILDDLVDCHLLVASYRPETREMRYRFVDLVRLYAEQLPVPDGFPRPGSNLATVTFLGRGRG
ncbi:AfsR/SARP family transcriptional regulator [Thermomonospora amylolytica]|uniref:AfsR/SARP family transcriptional regulator n=1 Tax=Thermomonospora amylolytica TaxID=1411117 RepID=UPI000E6CEC5B|nr:BTAD domain-containing putative transcriptional regulator [Thermomonospora amylolytica]